MEKFIPESERLIPYTHKDDVEKLKSITSYFNDDLVEKLKNHFAFLKMFYEEVEKGEELVDEQRELIFNIGRELDNLYSNIGRTACDFFDIKYKTDNCGPTSNSIMNYE